MVAYIFKAQNSVTHKTFIGKNYSVKFDKLYLGNNPGVISDVQKYGIDKFTINMIMACETVKDCDMAYDAVLKEFNACNDINFYNCEKTQEPEVKKPRKKKGTAEE